MPVSAATLRCAYDDDNSNSDNNHQYHFKSNNKILIIFLSLRPYGCQLNAPIEIITNVRRRWCEGQQGQSGISTFRESQILTYPNTTYASTYIFRYIVANMLTQWKKHVSDNGLPRIGIRTRFTVFWTSNKYPGIALYWSHNTYSEAYIQCW